MVVITQKYLCSILEYDKTSGLLTWKSRDISMFKNKRNYAAFKTRFQGKPLGTVWNGPRGKKYLQCRIKSKTYYCHRIIWLLVTGSEPLEIDHINGDGLDNNWSNLREVTHTENGRNLCVNKNNSTGATGVTFDGKKWIAKIFVSGKNLHLGRFNNIEDAKNKRKEAEVKYGFYETHGRKERPDRAIQQLDEWA